MSVEQMGQRGANKTEGDETNLCEVAQTISAME